MLQFSTSSICFSSALQSKQTRNKLDRYEKVLTNNRTEFLISEYQPFSRLPLGIAAHGHWPDKPSHVLSSTPTGSSTHSHPVSRTVTMCYCVLSPTSYLVPDPSLLSHDNKCLQAIRTSLWRSRSVSCKPLVLARSPHAPPRLPWSRTRPSFLRLLWSTLPIIVVGSRQPYRSLGEDFCV